MPECSTCGVELVEGQNWRPWAIKSHKNQCLKCAHDYNVAYRHRPYALKKSRERETERRKIRYRYNWSYQTIMHHKQSGYTVNLTPLELEAIAKTVNNCPICDTELGWYVGKGKSVKMNSPTLDRVNNETILTKDNIMIVCNRCNSTKLDRTLKEFIDYCGMVYNKYLGVI